MAEEWVLTEHPDLDGQVLRPRSSFENLHSKKGWVEVAAVEADEPREAKPRADVTKKKAPAKKKASK